MISLGSFLFLFKLFPKLILLSLPSISFRTKFPNKTEKHNIIDSLFNLYNLFTPNSLILDKIFSVVNL